jgi:hypothetical protein
MLWKQDHYECLQGTAFVQSDRVLLYTFLIVCFATVKMMIHHFSCQSVTPLAPSPYGAQSMV